VDDEDQFVALDVCGFGEVGIQNDDGSISALGSCNLRGAADAAEFNARRVVDVQGELRVDGSGPLEEILFENLERVSGIVLTQNRDLRSVGMPALVQIRNYLSIGNNGSLEKFEARALTVIGGSVVIRDNPVLDYCAIDELLSQLETPPPTLVLDGECITPD